MTPSTQNKVTPLIQGRWVIMVCGRVRGREGRSREGRSREGRREEGKEERGRSREGRRREGKGRRYW